jgi:hypothetical protein
MGNRFKVDRSKFSVSTLERQDVDEITYWKGKTPHERLEALEVTRQIIYGYDPATTGLQRFFEVAKHA